MDSPTNPVRSPQPGWIAFAESRRIADGSPGDVAAGLKAFAGKHPTTPFLVFDRVTSQPIELDLRGTLAAILKRLPLPPPPAPPAEDTPDEPRLPGRPKLGVVAREVTLLPRHWEWLGTQPGGASAALRKLVEHERRASQERDRVRAAQESAYRFMNAMAGNEPGYEEATRALFAGNLERLRANMSRWPADVRRHALELAASGTSQEKRGPRDDSDRGITRPVLPLETAQVPGREAARERPERPGEV